jgi:protein-S-isoprenylcysteine O-methyltransferase Ste14
MSGMLQIAAYIVLGLCWIAWSLAFVKPQRNAAGQKKAVRAPSSRWGILLVMLAFACEWAFIRPQGFHPPDMALIASILIGPPSVALAWMATRHLDKQWRFEAALSEDHELIKTGPYRWLRHPIYTSMLGMLLETGLAKAWWPLLVAGVVFYMIGTEIRIRAEERLLASRFGEEFSTYRRSARAYVPFLR